MLTWSVLTRTDRPEGGKPRVYESKHYQSYADAVSVAVVALDAALAELFPLMSMADVNVLRNRAREEWMGSRHYVWKTRTDEEPAREASVTIWQREEDVKQEKPNKAHPSDVIDTQFFLGGHAVFTVGNDKGEHYTYQVTKSKPSEDRMPVHFVALLTGPDNENDYNYLGLYDSTKLLRMTKASRLAEDSKPCKVFRWALRKVRDNQSGDRLPQGYTIRHAGKCCRCGRTLTTPESIERGIGPECADKMGW